MKTVKLEDTLLTPEVGMVIESDVWLVIVEVELIRGRDGLEYFVIAQDKEGEEFDISDDYFWKYD